MPTTFSSRVPTRARRPGSPTAAAPAPSIRDGPDPPGSFSSEAPRRDSISRANSSTNSAMRLASVARATRTASIGPPPIAVLLAIGLRPLVEQLIHPVEDRPPAPGGRFVGSDRHQFLAIQPVEALDHLGRGQRVECRKRQGGP